MYVYKLRYREIQTLAEGYNYFYIARCFGVWIRSKAIVINLTLVPFSF
jgi:hypothetical protein